MSDMVLASFKRKEPQPAEATMLNTGVVVQMTRETEDKDPVNLPHVLDYEAETAWIYITKEDILKACELMDVIYTLTRFNIHRVSERTGRSVEWLQSLLDSPVSRNGEVYLYSYINDGTDMVIEDEWRLW